MLNNLLVKDLKKGNWSTTFSKECISGCLKSAKLNEICNYERNGKDFIAYDQNNKILMFRVHKYKRQAA